MFKKQSAKYPALSEKNDHRDDPLPSDDLVKIPHYRRHDSGTTGTLGGILLAAVVAIIGGIVLGGACGAWVALSGEKYINIVLVLSFPFWMHTPAQMGFMWGHLQDPTWRNRISLLGFFVCFYSYGVGWLVGILDGPGLVFNPIELVGYFFDVSVYGLWVIDMGLVQDIIPLTPYLLTLRFVELFWLAFTGYFSMGAETPYPYCQCCKKWMDDETTFRLNYNPYSNEEVQKLAGYLVANKYQTLFAINQPVDKKSKGLELNLFRCEKCNESHVLNAIWYRSTPDPEKSETEQLIESRLGTHLVSDLIIPAEVHAHLVQLAISEAEETSVIETSKTA